MDWIDVGLGSVDTSELVTCFVIGKFSHFSHGIKIHATLVIQLKN